MSFSDQEILKLFPYPSFRKGQAEIILKINNAFKSGIRCILLSVPTGIGKSGINTTFCRAIDSFYTTPQNTLIDQIKSDQYLKDYFVEIKGRNNYECIKDYSGNSTVDVGMCTRFLNYIPTYCRHTYECPYYSQKLKAVESQIILTNPVYLILEGRVADPSPPRMGVRNLLVVDEGHFIENTLISVSTIEIKQWIYSSKSKIPEIRSKSDIINYVKHEEAIMREKVNSIEIQKDLDGNISHESVRLKNQLNNMLSSIYMFLDNTDKEWIYEIKFSNIAGKTLPYLSIKPLYGELFGNILWRKVWDSTGKVIVSSATLLNPRNFIEITGLSRKFKRSEILFLEAPAIFPKENRPIIDMSIGSMTFDKQNSNLEKACSKLEYILDMESGNVVVHIPSYNLVDKIIETMRHLKSKHWHRFITHNSGDRTAKLEEWTGKRGYVFFAVAFTEGYDWGGDKCDAQVLFKVPYPDINDKRIARLLELKRYEQYYTTTLITVIQAYGRAVRSEQDKKNFYVIDSSFWKLMRLTKNSLPYWFKECLPQNINL
jgi:Rad3-related DNA helicase